MTACRRGHDLSKPGALYISGNHRQCIICHKLAMAKRRRARGQKERVPSAVKTTSRRSVDSAIAILNDRILHLGNQIDIAPAYLKADYRAALARAVEQRDALERGAP